MLEDEGVSSGAADPEGRVRCEVTGGWHLSEDCVEFQGKLVSAEGKALLVAGLRDGSAHADALAARPSFWRRMSCALLDALVLAAAMYFLLPLMIRVLRSVLQPGDPAGAIRLVMVTSLFFPLAYYTVMHAAYGQTLGKMAGGYKVVNRDGTPISFWTALARTVWFQLPLVIVVVASFVFSNESWTHLFAVRPLYALATFLVMLLDRQQARPIHDFLAGTRVVMKRGKMDRA